MRNWFVGVAAALALGACASTGAAPETAQAQISTAHIAAAVADPRRPAEDTARVAARRPADMLAFAQVAPGDRVADLIPGGGYFTRPLSVAVGDAGRIYAIIPPPQANATQPAIYAVAEAHPNVTVQVGAFPALTLPEPVDLVWTAQNYHDLHLQRFNLDVGAVNRAIFNALKPGGLYVIVDHSAVAGAEVGVADTLHRIDQARVRAEVEAAGFVFDGESDVLRNSADNRTTNVFDPAIRGHTDQFVMRFRRPE